MSKTKKEAALFPVRSNGGLGGWLPIETAPLDGSHIQLYRPKIQFVGYYAGANSGWKINAPGWPSMWPLPTHWAELRKNPNVELTGSALLRSPR